MRHCRARGQHRMISQTLVFRLNCFDFLSAHSFDKIPNLNWFSENLSGQGFHLTRESSREHDCLLVWSDAVDNSHHLIAKKGVKLSINRKNYCYKLALHQTQGGSQ